MLDVDLNTSKVFFKGIGHNINALSLSWHTFMKRHEYPVNPRNVLTMHAELVSMTLIIENPRGTAPLRMTVLDNQGEVSEIYRHPIIHMYTELKSHGKVNNHHVFAPGVDDMPYVKAAVNYMLTGREVLTSLAETGGALHDELTFHEGRAYRDGLRYPNGDSLAARAQ
jgi:hypothetical protein